MKPLILIIIEELCLWLISLAVFILSCDIVMILQECKSQYYYYIIINILLLIFVVYV